MRTREQVAFLSDKPTNSVRDRATDNETDILCETDRQTVEEAGASSLHTKESTAHLSARSVSPPVRRLESVSRSVVHSVTRSVIHTACVVLSLTLPAAASHTQTVCSTVIHIVGLSVSRSLTLFVSLSLISRASSVSSPSVTMQLGEIAGSD